MVMVKTSVIIAIFIWCCPINPNICLCCASMQRHLTSDWGLPTSSFCSGYCMWPIMCLCTILQVSVCIFRFWIWFHRIIFGYVFIHYSYQGNREIMNSNEEIYSEWKFTVDMSIRCWSVCSLAMVLVKGRILSEVMKDVELQGHQLCFVDLKLYTITRSA